MFINLGYKIQKISIAFNFDQFSFCKKILVIHEKLFVLHFSVYNYVFFSRNFDSRFILK